MTNNIPRPTGYKATKIPPMIRLVLNRAIKMNKNAKNEHAKIVIKPEMRGKSFSIFCSFPSGPFLMARYVNMMPYENKKSMYVCN